MSTSTTTNLGLVLDNADEPVKTHHRHANENLATLDVTIKSLQDSMANAKALLGQLGIDADDHYAVDAETARTTLGVPSLSDIGDIVRQNVPLMSPTTLGGAKLGSGLEIEDEKLRVIGLYVDEDGDWCQE